MTSEELADVWQHYFFVFSSLPRAVYNSSLDHQISISPNRKSDHANSRLLALPIHLLAFNPFQRIFNQSDVTAQRAFELVHARLMLFQIVVVMGLEIHRHASESGEVRELEESDGGAEERHCGWSEKGVDEMGVKRDRD